VRNASLPFSGAPTVVPATPTPLYLLEVQDLQRHSYNVILIPPAKGKKHMLVATALEK